MNLVVLSFVSFVSGLCAGALFMRSLHVSPQECARIVWKATRPIFDEYTEMMKPYEVDSVFMSEMKKIRLETVEAVDAYLESVMGYGYGKKNGERGS